MTEQELYEPYRTASIVTLGGEVYIPKRQAAQFLARCNKEGFGILGIDCIRQEGNRTILDSELIADFSSRAREDDSSFLRSTFEDALRFLDGIEGDEIFFSFTLKQVR
ncbi:MAG: hypothetical protein U0975_00960 [Erythrobacter sp.]|nr:hypothetical protein [Xanthomonadaceae bacterium]MDP2184356.1 hypothetical protein [Xanthomonadales bacterium]MDZ4271220.1 hypothetical protein [Erythrobacter sp.]